MNLAKLNFSDAEIKALLVACEELNEKLGFVVKDYYIDFNLGFKSNDELINGLLSANEKLEFLIKVSKWIY